MPSSRMPSRSTKGLRKLGGMSVASLASEDIVRLLRTASASIVHHCGTVRSVPSGDCRAAGTKSRKSAPIGKAPPRMRSYGEQTLPHLEIPMNHPVRHETDSFGPIEVPAEAL